MRKIDPARQPLTAREEASVNRLQGKGLRSAPERRSRKYTRRALVNNRSRADKAIRNFYNNVDLPEFKQALEFSKDPKFQMLLYAMSNKRLLRCSFAEICKRCDLTVLDIANLWRSYHMSKGIMRQMPHVADVMEDVAIDSKSRVVVCPRCAGEGKLNGELMNKQSGAICPDCYGDGKIRLVGDKDARSLLYESIGLKKSGGSVVQTTNVNLGSLPSLEDTIGDVERALDIQATEAVDVENRIGEAFKEIGKTSEAGEGDDGGAAAEGGAGAAASAAGADPVHKPSAVGGDHPA